MDKTETQKSTVSAQPVDLEAAAGASGAKIIIVKGTINTGGTVTVNDAALVFLGCA